MHTPGQLALWRRRAGEPRQARGSDTKCDAGDCAATAYALGAREIEGFSPDG
jgi:hypothetical protein